MSKYAVVIAICLLGAMLAFAQSSQPAPAQQPPSQSASQPGQSQPQQPANQGPGTESDRNAASGPTGPSNPAATNGQPVQPQARGNIGWGWLIVAVIVGVIIISLLSRGRTERVTHIEHAEDDRDDIRRAG